MTNGDKIRAMTDEELAMLLFKCPYENEIGDHCTENTKNIDGEIVMDCDACTLDWLKSEVKESEQG